jgi:hypothetical protein
LSSDGRPEPLRQLAQQKAPVHVSSVVGNASTARPRIRPTAEGA